MMLPDVLVTPLALDLALRTLPAGPGNIPSAQALLDAMSEAVYVVDRSRRITYWNAAAEQLTGYRADEVVGRRCRDGILNHVDDAGTPLCSTRCPLLGTIRDGEPRDMVAFLHHRDGHRVPVAVRSAVLRSPGGTVTGAVEVFHDDSRYHTLADRLDELEQQALTDALTGIANRRMLERVLCQRQEDDRRYGRTYAVLFADIDHFKLFNDQYGHEVGDEVLHLVAATLEGCTRAGDTAGRWGGEEFLIVATAADNNEAFAFADRTRRLVASTWIQHEGGRIGISLSVGVALSSPEEGASELVKRADAAMLTAKSDGRNRTALA